MVIIHRGQPRTSPNTLGIMGRFRVALKAKSQAVFRTQPQAAASVSARSTTKILLKDHLQELKV